MKSAKATKLEAQEFYFDEQTGFYTIQDGEKKLGSKEVLKTKLFNLVNSGQVKEIVPTRRHSYTFIQEKDKYGEELMPVRVYLNREDCREDIEDNNQVYFENLRVACKAKNRVKGINKLMLYGATSAMILTGSYVLTVAMVEGDKKEQQENNEYISSYVASNQEAREQELSGMSEEIVFEDNFPSHTL